MFRGGNIFFPNKFPPGAKPSFNAFRPKNGRISRYSLCVLEMVTALFVGILDGDIPQQSDERLLRCFAESRCSRCKVYEWRCNMIPQDGKQ